MVRNALVCGSLAACLLMVISGCDGPSAPVPTEPQTEFVTVRRAWRPGERDSAVARILRTRQLTFPYVGDVSDYADQLLDPDSAVELVPRSSGVPSVRSPFGPSYDRSGVRVPGTGWTSAGLDIRIIDNTQAPPDTNDWLSWFWWNNADSTKKGFVFIFSRNTTVGATFVNTPAFDASFGKSGAGAGEVQGTTTWIDSTWVRRNTASVTLNFAFGGVTTVTSGSFTGGTSQIALMSGVLDSLRLSRVLGTGTPNPQFASVTFSFVGSLRLTCVFPTPCTSAAMRQLVAARAAGMRSASGR